MTAPSDAPPPLEDVTEPNGTWRATQISDTEAALMWQPNEPGLDPSQQLRDQAHDTGVWWIGPGQWATWQATPVDEQDDTAGDGDGEA